MTATMACRGPNDEGTWVDGPAALGHRRLAIIDLAGGRQPMTVQDEGRSALALVHSGATYNFRELRERLASVGHRFETSSDTEVVLHAHLDRPDSPIAPLLDRDALRQQLAEPMFEFLLLGRPRGAVRASVYAARLEVEEKRCSA